METTKTTSYEYDEGLRKFFVGVYAKLSLGLLITAALAYLSVAIPDFKNMLYTLNSHGKLGYTILGYIVTFAPLALIFIIDQRSAKGSSFLYWSIAALMGLSLGANFLIYTGTSLATTFIITSGAFGGLSLYGYLTKHDLGPIGRFAYMALFGMILILIVNLFVQSTVIQIAMMVIGLGIFSVLTAYDTQKLKQIYEECSDDAERREAASNIGALNLYLDFVNLFLLFMRLFGQRKD